MQPAAHAVAHKFPNHRKAVVQNDFLNGMAKFAQPVSLFRLRDPCSKGVLRGF
jgi:hypothetical protein